MSHANTAVIRLRTAVFDACTEKAGLITDKAKAEAFGVSRGGVNRIRNGHVTPSSDFIASACHALKIRIDDLFEIITHEMTP